MEDPRSKGTSTWITDLEATVFKGLALGAYGRDCKANGKTNGT